MSATAGPRLEILVDRAGVLTRAAVLRDGRLTDLAIDRADRPSLVGSVFRGVVERIVPGLDGAFVDLGTGKPGLLSAADARGPKGRVERIGTLLRAGEPVLVQVKADASGAKGPTLTMDIALAGRFLVHAPKARGISVSRRLAQGAERGELLRRIETAASRDGWIVRAAAANAHPELLAREADALAGLWRSIERAAPGSAAALLQGGPDAATRTLLDHAAVAPDAILVDGPEPLATLRTFCDGQAPDLAAVLTAHRGQPGLFELRDLDTAIAGLAVPRVPLDHGGSLVIERTEALTAVDVNAGERGNPLAVNLEAAAEVARQLRLRNLGGIVVVDFVSMKGRGDGERLLAALSGAVADDPAQTQVYGLSRLGLVELTRARRGVPLAEILCDLPADTRP